MSKRFPNRQARKQLEREAREKSRRLLEEVRKDLEALVVEGSTVDEHAGVLVSVESFMSAYRMQTVEPLPTVKVKAKDPPADPPFRASFEYEPDNPDGCVYWQVEQGYDDAGVPFVSANHSRTLVEALREAADALESDLGALGAEYGLPKILPPPRSDMLPRRGERSSRRQERESDSKGKRFPPVRVGSSPFGRRGARSADGCKRARAFS